MSRNLASIFLVFSCCRFGCGQVLFMSIRDGFDFGRVLRFNTADSTLDLIHKETVGIPSQLAIDDVNADLYWALSSAGDTPSIRRL